MGGTRIEAWSTPEALNNCHVQPFYPSFPWDSEDIEVYNAMINPLHKLTIKGVLWYQGELEQE